MTHKNQESGSKAVTKLPKMEMYAVLGLETMKRILEKLDKLESIEDSLEILAAQKKRELDRLE